MQAQSIHHVCLDFSKNRWIRQQRSLAERLFADGDGLAGTKHCRAGTWCVVSGDDYESRSR